MTTSNAHYLAPGFMTRRVLNPTVALLTRCGVSLLGSRVLETIGRSSGQPRQTPVNLLILDGSEYLVSARGHGQWVRNVRAAQGRLTLVLGRKRTDYVGTDIDPADPRAAAILRAYLKRWKAEVGAFFEGVGPDSSDAELLAIAGRHPIFVLDRA